MKRKLICVLLCLLFVLSTFVVEAFAEKLNSEDVDWGISMKAEQVTPNGAVILVNQSGGNHTGDLECGRAYHLEVWKENTWEQLPYIREDAGWWTTEAWLLPENRVTRWEVDWTNLYGALNPGHYRFVKEFMDYRENGNDEADFYAVFSIGGIHDYCDEGADWACDTCSESMPVYRVVGNSDWMGNWDAANDLGIMTKVGEGLYRKTFKDVPPGDYELKITKDGKWDDSYGDDGNNLCFTVSEQMNVTIDFRLKNGIGVIDVYNDRPISWGEDDEAQESNADTSDLRLSLYVVLLPVCIAVVSLLLTKRKKMQ